MDRPNPYAPPSGVVDQSPRSPVLWKAGVWYGVALAMADVLVGALSPPDSFVIGELMAFAFEASIFGFLGYRLKERLALHGLLAIVVEYVLGLAAYYALRAYVAMPEEPLFLTLMGWASTLAALAAGLSIGSLLRRRRRGGA